MIGYESIESPWEAPGVWLKANLHTHSTCSDGTCPPEQILDLYSEADYDVLVLSDHGRVAIPEVRRVGRLLHIPGVEFDTWTREPQPGVGWHIVGFPLTQSLPDYQRRSPQEIVDFIRDQGAFPIMAHPYWLGQSHEALTSVDGYAIIEVWNAVCDRQNGKSDSSTVWDDLLYRGYRVGAVAVDDCHDTPLDLGRGWTWIRAEENEPDAILEALRRGRFYASCGPKIYDLRFDGGEAHVRCSSARRVVFVGSAWTGESVVAPEGETITEAEMPMASGSAYFRVMVEALDGRRAWSNPVFLT